jgi:hypothetical protein
MMLSGIGIDPDSATITLHGSCQGSTGRERYSGWRVYKTVPGRPGGDDEIEIKKKAAAN